MKDINFEVPGGSSCGVVGRTGSGKSTLLLTLFRLIPSVEGQILFDGIDISTIGIDALRKRISIIPQEPVLFSGTLRYNLSPWGQHSDAELFDVLQQAQLKDKITSMSGGLGLDMLVSESGDNFSAGQKQLLCLARILLQDSHILALDEATANVDSGTDAQIKETVRKACFDKFGGVQRTLVVIAHRLDTVMDCDKVLVLSNGELVEQGSPIELLSTQDGHFREMAMRANLIEE